MTEHNSIAEIIEKHRSNCSSYVKLDIGILALIGTIATIFKLEKLEIFRFIGYLKFILSFIIILLVFGIVFDRWLLKLWSQVKLNVIPENSVIKWVSRGTTIQVMSHVFFIALIGGLVIGFVTGYVGGYDATMNMISLQTEIENFALEEERFPKDLDELIDKSPITKFQIKDLGSNKIIYSTHDTRGYILRYAGRDGKLNTEDDMIHDHKFYVGLFKKGSSQKSKTSPNTRPKD